MQIDVSDPKSTSKRGRPKGAYAWPGHAAKLACSLITTLKGIGIAAGEIDSTAIEIDNTASRAAVAMRLNQTAILAVASQLMRHPDRGVAELGIRLAQLGDAEEAIKTLLDIRHQANDQRTAAAQVLGSSGDSAARLAAALVGEYWQKE